MESKETRFSYVYHDLRGRIESGQLQPGKNLPSGRQLCKDYQVSIRTINDVLAALKREGFITVEPRKAPVVCRRGGIDSSSMVLSVLGKKEEILQIYHTMTLLLPPLLTFASQGCPLEDMPHYRQAMKVDQRKLAAGGWRPVSGLIKDVLGSGGNWLFSDVFSAFIRYNHTSFFAEEQEAFTGLSPEQDSPEITPLLQLLHTRDTGRIYLGYTSLYQHMEVKIADCIGHLEASFPGCPQQKEMAFSWNPWRGNDHFYTRIVRDLVDKIGTGFYPPDTYLPHEAQLAKEYRVSVFTIRKALAETARLGFTKTYNIKGTVALIPDDTIVFRSLQNQTSKRDTLTYLYALQFLSLAIRPAAMLAAVHLTPEDLSSLALAFDKPQTIPLEDIYQCLLAHIPLAPFCLLMEELGKLAQWGYYFAFYRNNSTNTNLLNQKTLEAFRSLRAGDIQDFADRLSECYGLILCAVRQFVTDKYHLYEAQDIRTPDLRFPPSA